MTVTPAKRPMRSFAALTLALALVLMPTIFFATDRQNTPSDDPMCGTNDEQTQVVRPPHEEQQPGDNGDQGSGGGEPESDPDESAPESSGDPADEDAIPPAESDSSSGDEDSGEQAKSGDPEEGQSEPKAKTPADARYLPMTAPAVTNEQGLKDALAAGVADIRISGVITIHATLTIDYGVTITGGTFRAGAPVTPMFHINAPGDRVAFVNATFNGAGIASGLDVTGGDLAVQNCAFQYMHTSGSGAAIHWMSDGCLAVDKTHFTDCSAGVHGGGIFAQKGEIAVRNSTFVRQAAAGDGGAVYVDSSVGKWDVDAGSCVFHECVSGANGNMVFSNDRKQNQLYQDQGKATCTVTLNEGAGAGLTDKVFQVDSGGRFFPSEVPSCPYHTFDGWYYRDRNGDLQKWEPDSVVLEDVELLAQYSPIHFSLQFYDDDQSTQLFDPILVPAGSTLNAGQYIPAARSGYEFIGWSYMDSGLGEMGLWTDDIQVMTDYMMYAVWKAVPGEEPSSSASESSSGNTGGGGSSSASSGSSSTGGGGSSSGSGGTGGGTDDRRPPDGDGDRDFYPRIETLDTATNFATIEDEDVPLADIPAFTIDDDPVPLAGIPFTGVPVAFKLAAFALVPSAIVALGTAPKRRKP